MINRGVVSTNKIVAVFINYRDAKRSFKCIESLLRNKIEKIIVWDNSEDEGESLSALRVYISEIKNIETIYSEKNIGFAAAINLLLVLCQEKYPNSYVLIINNDAILLDNGAVMLVAALEQNNEYVLAVPMINHAGRVTGASFYNKWSGLLSFHEKKGYFRYPSGCCFLINIEKISMPFFDEAFFMYGEDWELGWKLPPNSIKYLDRVLVNHEGSASSGLGSRFYEERMVAAHLMLARKIAKNNSEYALLTMVRLIILPMRACVRSFRFRSLTPFYALFWGIKIAWFD